MGFFATLVDVDCDKKTGQRSRRRDVRHQITWSIEPSAAGVSRLLPAQALRAFEFGTRTARQLELEQASKHPICAADR